MAQGLAALREREGRLFILGVGGGAGHASHAVNDFRKLCRIESYAPTDNVSELTARTNDDGWETSFTEWLAVSRFSANRRAARVQRRRRLARAQRLGQPRQRDRARARARRRRSTASSARRTATLAQLADVAIVIDAPPDLKTPLVESFQAVVWHALVSHPGLAARQGHWESLAASVKAAFVDRDGVINELVPDPITGAPESPLRSRRRRAPARGGRRAETAACRRLAARGRLEPARGGQGARGRRAAARNERPRAGAPGRRRRQVRRIRAVPAPPTRRRRRAAAAAASAASRPPECCWPQRASSGSS